MFRTVAAIACAILQSQPTMPIVQANGYASIVQSEANEHNFDPFLMVSIVHKESEWVPTSNNGKCFGFGGICLSNYSYCREDLQSEKCQRRKASLMHGPTNLRIAAFLIEENRRFCMSKTGRSEAVHWLQSYQGFNSFERNRWCGQEMSGHAWSDTNVPKITTSVLRRYEQLKDSCSMDVGTGQQQTCTL